jgi:hypothetical protein
MNKKLPRKLIKEAKKEIHRLEIKVRKVENTRKNLEEEIIRLQAMEDACDHFSVERTARSMNLTTNQFLKTKIWLVTKHEEGHTAVLTEFFDLLRDKKPMTMVLEGILANKPFIGSDGKVVSLELGSLLVVNRVPVTKGVGIHLANIFPSDEKGKIQYQYLLNKLGLGIKQYIEGAFDLQTDGQFRALVAQQI